MAQRMCGISGNTTHGPGRGAAAGRAAGGDTRPDRHQYATCAASAPDNRRFLLISILPAPALPALRTFLLPPAPHSPRAMHSLLR
ncbi:hypothetical protein EVAR_18002_1 [Eumeta japonica]|uniref:Uncharacterized protein n=1 Tax=Eumeta variegata TaxID=151549 RepID=A0A4C1Y9C3_EUMVA|nr:hypothetical protein EVAR_18002_1 [Eumeta japonica]